MKNEDNLKSRRMGIMIYIIFLTIGLLFSVSIINHTSGAGPVQQTPNVTSDGVNPQLAPVSSGTRQSTIAPSGATAAPPINLISSMLNRIEQLEWDLTALKQKVVEQEKKLAATQQKLSDQEQKLATAEQKLSDVEKRLASAYQKLSDQEQKLSGQQQVVSKLNDSYWKHVHDYDETKFIGGVISLLGFKKMLDTNPGAPYLIQIIHQENPSSTTTYSTKPPK